MAIYSVYLPPDGDAEKARFLPDGRSLFALVVPAVFLLWNRLWFAFGMYTLAALALALIGVLAGETVAALLSALPGLFLFLHGRELVRERLDRDGWIEAAVFSAEDEEEAELRFFGRPRRTMNPAVPLTAMKPAVVPAAPSSFGMFPE